MRLNGNQYPTEDDYQAAIEREWREWISTFPEVARLSPEEQEPFKRFYKRLIEHLNS